jgi:hypothetical protein
MFPRKRACETVEIRKALQQARDGDSKPPAALSRPRFYGVFAFRKSPKAFQTSMLGFSAYCSGTQTHRDI